MGVERFFDIGRGFSLAPPRPRAESLRCCREGMHPPLGALLVRVKEFGDMFLR